MEAARQHRAVQQRRQSPGVRQVPQRLHLVDINFIVQPLGLRTAASVSGAASAVSATPASEAYRSGRWAASKMGCPKPEAPTTQMVWLASGGITGSWGAWAFKGRRAAPSASTST